ncbi:hypothetical protein [Streptomyces sp. NPDC003717]|uniref:hypothetical protein n=1 Tax=Streptomyces sp. NPDC003717 TaxID=3154276 RepID=UPI0033BE6F36
MSPESVQQPAAAESDVDLAAGDLARQMGMYGPEVAMPATAPTLDRVLGLTGRDPAWA